MVHSTTCTSDLFNPACFLGIPSLLWATLCMSVLLATALAFWWFKVTDSENISIPVRLLITLVFTMWFMAASLNGVKTQPDATMQRYVVGASAILVVTGVGVSRLLASAGVAVYKLVLKHQSRKNMP